jgi:GT2 family glycosyltransferase
MNRENLLIIPAYIAKLEHAQMLGQCLTTLRKTTDERVMIIDDGSPDTPFKNVHSEAMEKFEDVEVVLVPENRGFSATVNFGLNCAIQNEMNAVLVNSDILFNSEDWLEKMIETDADIVGALLCYPNNIIQHAGVFFSPITRAFDHRYKGAPHDYPLAQELCECPVTAALQMIKWECLSEVGLYDEGFKMSHEDVDFCLRAITEGYTSVYNPEVKALHLESMFRADASQKVKEWERESAKYLMRKWHDQDFYEIAPSMFERNTNE